MLLHLEPRIAFRVVTIYDYHIHSHFKIQPYPMTYVLNEEMGFGCYDIVIIDKMATGISYRHEISSSHGA